MYPYLFTDDLVSIKPIKTDVMGFSKEDILFIKSDNRYLIHRYYSNTNDFVITKGDNLNTPDGPSQRIIGVVTHRKLTVKSLLKRIKYYFLTQFLR